MEIFASVTYLSVSYLSVSCLWWRIDSCTLAVSYRAVSFSVIQCQLYNISFTFRYTWSVSHCPLCIGSYTWLVSQSVSHSAVLQPFSYFMLTWQEVFQWSVSGCQGIYVLSRGPVYTSKRYVHHMSSLAGVIFCMVVSVTHSPAYYHPRYISQVCCSYTSTIYYCCLVKVVGRYISKYQSHSNCYCYYCLLAPLFKYYFNVVVVK